MRTARAWRGVSLIKLLIKMENGKGYQEMDKQPVNKLICIVYEFIWQSSSAFAEKIYNYKYSFNVYSHAIVDVQSNSLICMPIVESTYYYAQ